MVFSTKVFSFLFLLLFTQQIQPYSTQKQISQQKTQTQTSLLIPTSSNSTQTIQNELITQENTYFPSIFAFLMGFRIVGMQMLSVFQNFQLLLSIQNYKSFQISFNIHGFNDSKYYPFNLELSKNGQSIFQNFNLMMLLILILFIAGIFCKLCGQIKLKNLNLNLNQDQINFLNTDLHEKQHFRKKILKKPRFRQKSGQNQLMKEKQNICFDEIGKKQNIKSQTSCNISQDLSEASSHDFIVHFASKALILSSFKKLPLLSQNGQQKIILNNINLSSERVNNSNCLIQFSNIILFQILFDLVINSFSIIVFSLTSEIKHNEYLAQHSFFTFNKVFIIGFYFTILITLIVMMNGFVQQFVFYGENSLKFHASDTSLKYWIIIISQKLIYSILLGLRVLLALYIIIGVKILVIFLFVFIELYFQKVQKIRTIIIQILHFFLLILFLIKKQGLISLSTVNYVFQIIYIITLSIIALLTLTFYARQFIFKLKADFRNNQEDLGSVIQSSEYSNSENIGSIIEACSRQQCILPFNSLNSQRFQSIANDCQKQIEQIKQIEQSSQENQNPMISNKLKATFKFQLKSNASYRERGLDKDKSISLPNKFQISNLNIFPKTKKLKIKLKHKVDAIINSNTQASQNLDLQNNLAKQFGQLSPCILAQLTEQKQVESLDKKQMYDTNLKKNKKIQKKIKHRFGKIFNKKKQTHNQSQIQDKQYNNDK